MNPRLCVRLLAVAVGLTVSRGAAEPVATGRGGAVASISAPATRAGMEILRAGGNAVDAAIATAATLGVTDPFSCGIGGGGFMLIYRARDQHVIALDFRETAPRYVTSTHFQPEGRELGFEEAMMSGRSIGVPGTVRGWHEALQRYGTMDLAAVLAPAIRAAEKGFVVDADFHAMTSEHAEKFARFTSSSALFLHDGRALPVGTLFRNPDLARTYQEIAAGGVQAFYDGAIAGDIVATANRPPTAGGGAVAGARMTIADLQDYEVRFRDPIRSSYRGHEIFGMPTPSSGGIAIAQALNMLETFDLADRSHAQVAHLYLEASRLAFADRNAYLGDGEFVDLPVAGLISPGFAQARANLIHPQRAADVVAPGDPFAYQEDPSVPWRPRGATTPVASRESEHTTHFAVSDRAGNIVACTFTIEAFGGSGIVVPGRGFLLNNELTDFNFRGPHPNVPEARKRPRSSMSPTIVFGDGRPLFTIGSPGGATIITTVLQIIIHRIDGKMALADALAAPRLSQRNAATTEVEGRLGFAESEAANALASFGHRWTVVPEIGAANGIEFHADGTVTAVSEPVRRHGGSALVEER